MTWAERGNIAVGSRPARSMLAVTLPPPPETAAGAAGRTVPAQASKEAARMPETTLHDEQAIRDLIVHYFFGLDRRDPAAFKAVFSPDATFLAFDGKDRYSGTQDIIPMLLQGVGRYPVSTHQVASQWITVSGGHAQGDTSAVAYLATRDGNIAVRGLRYIDEFERLDVGWRIGVRRHIATWQFDVPGIPPALPG